MQKSSVIDSAIAIEEINNLPFFFILGRTRSGTTLLRSLFDAHPAVNIPTELPYLPLLFKKYGSSILSHQQIKEFVDDISIHSKFSMLRITKNDLLVKLIAAKNKFSNFNISHLTRIIAYNYPSFFEKSNITALGDKNPSYSLRINMLFSLFPDAKFIFVVRDYRDVAVSVINQNFELHNISIIAYLWKKSLKQYLWFKQKHPNQILLVRYEDFVNNPKDCFKNCCNFLNLECDPEVFNRIHKDNSLQKTYGENYSSSHASLAHPIHINKIGLWKSQLNSMQIRTADSVVGSYADEMGYSRLYPRFQILAIPRLIFAFSLLISAYLYNSILKLISNKYFIRYGPLFRVLAYHLYGKRISK